MEQAAAVPQSSFASSDQVHLPLVSTGNVSR
jgi:hypothetical protein